MSVRDYNSAGAFLVRRPPANLAGYGCGAERSELRRCRAHDGWVSRGADAVSAPAETAAHFSPRPRPYVPGGERPKRRPIHECS